MTCITHDSDPSILWLSKAACDEEPIWGFVIFFFTDDTH